MLLSSLTRYIVLWALQIFVMWQNKPWVKKYCTQPSALWNIIFPLGLIFFTTPWHAVQLFPNIWILSSSWHILPTSFGCVRHVTLIKHRHWPGAIDTTFLRHLTTLRKHPFLTAAVSARAPVQLRKTPYLRDDERYLYKILLWNNQHMYLQHIKLVEKTKIRLIVCHSEIHDIDL